MLYFLRKLEIYIEFFLMFQGIDFPMDKRFKSKKIG